MLSKTKNISNIKIIHKIKKQYYIKHALSKSINLKKSWAGILFLTDQKKYFKQTFQQKTININRLE